MKADINNNIYVSGEGHSLYFFFIIKTEQCAKWQTVIFVAILVKDKLSKINPPSAHKKDHRYVNLSNCS